MKQKFDCDANNLLGSRISLIRRSKNLTQEQLGRMVGMSKSGISKIESGQKRISAEEASVLIELMGEQMLIQVPGYEESPVTRELKSKFLSIGTFWFAQEYGMTNSDAFKFLLLYKAIDFMESNFLIEQTLPRAQVVNDLMAICSNNGGRI